MRVVMITHFPQDLSNPVGGVATASIALLRGLGRFEDLDLHVITDQVPRPDPYRLEDPPCTVHPIPRSRWLPGLIWGMTIQRGLIARVLAQLQPDVVHTQGWACWTDARRWPAVLTIHGVQELDVLHSERPLRRFRHLFIRMVEKRYRRRYQHIISISDYVNRQLEGQLPGRCHPIPNCVEQSFFDVVRQPVPHRVLFVGTIIPRKNIGGLIEAAGMIHGAVPDFSFHLAGSPDRHRQDYLEAQQRRCRQLGIADNMKFLGRLSRDQTRRELAGAACLVLASFQETLPVAIAEAMAAGVPIVAAEIAGIPEMVDDGETGFLIDPHRPDQIADRVTRILKDPALAERLGRRARQKADAYRPERVADQTMEVYRQVHAEWCRA